MNMKLIGLDIGGSKIDAILWENGKILRAEMIRTPRNRKDFLGTIILLIKGLMGEDPSTSSGPIGGIGVAMAGAIDIKKGLAMNSPNLKLIINFPIRSYLEKKFRIKVLLDNDSNCFLRAEHKFGQARGKRNVVGLTLGTGVGGGLLVDGKIVQGYHGAAAELGAVVIANLLTPTLSSRERRGRKGEEFFTVERLISGHGFRRLGLTDPLGIQIKAFAGDKKAIAIYNKIGIYLGIALANLVNIFDPELIVLGGGISRAGNLLIIPAKKEMAKHTLLPRSKLPPVVVSKLHHAGALGAIALFR